MGTGLNNLILKEDNKGKPAKTAGKTLNDPHIKLAGTAPSTQSTITTLMSTNTNTSQKPSGTAAKQYRWKLRTFVSHEKEAQRDENREYFANHTDPDELLQDDNFGFIPDATLHTIEKEILLICQIPVKQGDEEINIPVEYGIYPNNEVLVRPVKESGGRREVGSTFEAILANVSNSFFHLSLHNLASSPNKLESALREIRQADTIEIGTLLNEVPYEREKKGVNALSRNLLNILIGDRDASFDSDTVSNSSKKDSELYKNQSQREGIEKALSAEEICCLQGPPGTGKTRVITELVRRNVEAGNRVLATAESNTAIDNILLDDSSSEDTNDTCLHNYREEDNLQVARANPEKSTNPLVRYYYGGGASGGEDVVVATNNSAGDLSRAPLGDEWFDVSIIDEATQATQSSAAIPMSLASSTILIGDHKQLGPEPDSDLDEEIEQCYTSPFTLLYGEDGLYGDDLGVMFNIQYRMHEDIARFPNQEFYDGQLKNGTDNKTLDNISPLLLRHIDGQERKDGKSRYNEQEIGKVVDYVEKLVRNTSVQPGDIGVAAAYRAQADRLNKSIESADIENKQGIMVDIFDGFQGSERQAMILSFTVSNNRSDLGFLSKGQASRRLNVALTRAKQHLALFGDWELLREDQHGRFERLYQTVDEHGKVI